MLKQYTLIHCDFFAHEYNVIDDVVSVFLLDNIKSRLSCCCIRKNIDALKIRIHTVLNMNRLAKNAMYFVENHFTERFSYYFRLCSILHFHTDVLNMIKRTHVVFTLTFAAFSTIKNVFDDYTFGEEYASRAEIQVTDRQENMTMCRMSTIKIDNRSLILLTKSGNLDLYH